MFRPYLLQEVCCDDCASIPIIKSPRAHFQINHNNCLSTSQSLFQWRFLCFIMPLKVSILRVAGMQQCSASAKCVVLSGVKSVAHIDRVWPRHVFLCLCCRSVTSAVRERTKVSLMLIVSAGHVARLLLRLYHQPTSLFTLVLTLLYLMMVKLRLLICHSSAERPSLWWKN